MPVSYQWMKDGRMLAGQTSSTLMITNAGVADIGIYDVVVSNPAGMIISKPVRVGVGL
jgi:hypothetical protein